MKKFLKENWFKIIVSGVIILIGFSVFYYFVFYLPQIKKLEEKQEKERYISSMKEKCQEIGTKLYKERSTGIGYLVPKFAYNNKLNTCLYAEHTINAEIVYRGVIDMFTNETIIFHTRDFKTGQLIAGLSLEKYDTREIELFNE